MTGVYWEAVIDLLKRLLFRLLVWLENWLAEKIWNMYQQNIKSQEPLYVNCIEWLFPLLKCCNWTCFPHSNFLSPSRTVKPCLTLIYLGGLLFLEIKILQIPKKIFCRAQPGELAQWDLRIPPRTGGREKAYLG